MDYREMLAIARRYETAIAHAMVKALREAGIEDGSGRTRKRKRTRFKYEPTLGELAECRRQKHGVEGL